MPNVDTLSEAITDLRAKGYVEDFNLEPQCLECRGGAYKLFPEEFTVDTYYRFEGMTDPADEAVLYAISSDKYGLKGILVNGYGIYADDTTNEMVNKLRF